VSRAVVLVTVLLLCSCTAMPEASTFVSPVPRAHLWHVHLPLVFNDLLTAQPSPKKGISLACGYDNMERLAAETRALNVSWLWNWGPTPPIFEGVESVPSLWNDQGIGQPLGGNSQWLLGFNEPDDCPIQSCMTPEAAAVAWRLLEQAYPYRKKTSPQVLHPTQWLERWYTAYVDLYGQPPELDAIAVHTYYGGTAADYIARVQEFMALARKWNVPEVWVTEWTLAHGLDRSVRETTKEIETYVDWLEHEPMVTRYAPFTNRVECMSGAPYFQFEGPFDAPMYSPDGRLTEVGRTYRALPKGQE
jgi:hypothetical protein